jgi:hypothetical protein
MSSNPSRTSSDALAVFGKLRPLVDAALLRQYNLPPAAAAEVRERLWDWFRRFCHRPGMRSPEELESELLLMACRAGHVYSVGQPDEAPNHLVQRSVTLGPEIIAIEIRRATRGGDEE